VFLNEAMECAEQYVRARRCVKSRFGGGWGVVGLLITQLQYTDSAQIVGRI
jgi:hypothetical protein